MDWLVLLYLAFDWWRVFLPLGLSLILVAVSVGTNAASVPSRALVEKRLRTVIGPVAGMWWLVTGSLGVMVPSFLPDGLSGGGGAGPMVVYLEFLANGLGVYCLWLAKPKSEGFDQDGWRWVAGGCLLYLLLLMLWIFRWDGVAYPAGFSGAEMAWDRLFPKAIHGLLAALTCGGVVVMLIGGSPWRGKREILRQKGGESVDMVQQQVVRFGLGWVLGGVVPQVVVGSWLLVVLGDEVRHHFLHGLTFGSIVFFTSLIAGLLGLVLVNAAFIAPYVKGLIWGGWGSIVLSLYLMGFIRVESIRAAQGAIPDGIPLVPLELWYVVVGLVPLSGFLYGLRGWLKGSAILPSETPAA